MRAEIQTKWSIDKLSFTLQTAWCVSLQRHAVNLNELSCKHNLSRIGSEEVYAINHFEFCCSQKQNKGNKRVHIILTADQHDTDGKDLLWIGVWRNISKAHAGQTAEGEVKCRDILVLDRGAGARIAVVVSLPYGHAQIVQPANLVLQVRLLHVADGVPYTGQPVGNEGEDAHEQHEDCSAVLRVAVQLPGYAHQSQEPRCLQ